MLSLLLGLFLLSVIDTKLRGRSNLDLAHEVYCPDPSCPKDTSIFRSSRSDLPPLIYHINADKDWKSLKTMIEYETKLSQAYIDELLQFGAIYLEQPSRKPTMPKPNQKDNKSMKRILSDCGVKKDFYCRVHVNPRRYLLPSTVRWSNRLFAFHNSQYLLVNKPTGLPTAESLDNRIENVVFQTNQFLGNGSYLPTSRLDACTGGLLMLANSSNTAMRYHNLMKEQRIRKFYKALTYSPLPVGRILHLFPKPGSGNAERHVNSKPTLLRNINDQLQEKDSDWQQVELICLKSTPRNIASLSPEIQQVINSDPFRPNQSLAVIYENDIQLITGKTHQIRLQAAALGCAIIGDSRYQPVNGLCFQGLDTSHGDGSKLFGREPKSILLECHCLEIPKDLCKDDDMLEGGLTDPSQRLSEIEGREEGEMLVFSLKKSFWDHPTR